MRIAVATVKDTPAHVRRFVAGNLAGGVEHLVVFLDAPGADDQPEVAALLDAHPRVTAVRAGREWWGGARPRALNERQCVNANALKQVLAHAPGHWVFHVDGDEVVRLDPAAWSRVPPGTDVVRLAVREAVSRRAWDGEPTLWKHPLPESDLALLHTLGAIREPTDQALFHGHLMGKSGVRADAEGWFTLHKVVRGDHDPMAVAAHEDDGLRLFHYESYSGADFVRKWTAMVGSGPPASYRPGRSGVAKALRSLITKDLAPEVLEKYLMRIFERTSLDDVDTLLALGVLDDVDPLAPLSPTHEPAHTPGELEVVAQIEAGLHALRGEPKDHLFRGASARG